MTPIESEGRFQLFPSAVSRLFGEESAARKATHAAAAVVGHAVLALPQVGSPLPCLLRALGVSAASGVTLDVVAAFVNRCRGVSYDGETGEGIPSCYGRQPVLSLAALRGLQGLVTVVGVQQLFGGCDVEDRDILYSALAALGSVAVDVMARSLSCGSEASEKKTAYLDDSRVERAGQPLLDDSGEGSHEEETSCFCWM